MYGLTLLTHLLEQPLSWDHYVLGRFRFSRCWFPLGGNWERTQGALPQRCRCVAGYLLANLGFDGAVLVPACR